MCFLCHVLSLSLRKRSQAGQISVLAVDQTPVRLKYDFARFKGFSLMLLINWM